MTTVAVVGLGEAGARYARGFKAAGFDVSAFDPFVSLDEPGITQFDRIEESVAGAELVVSLVGARVAADVAASTLSSLSKGAVFADFNTASPATKRSIGDSVSSRAALFADVAVLAPVPRGGILTPLMASGAGADRFAELMEPTGAPVESIGGNPGDAAGRKLLRSVFMKGLAAIVLESVTAAEAAGQEDWVRAQIAAELSGDGEALVERLLTGSRQHAARRAHETVDASEYLAALGARHWTTDAATAWLNSLTTD